MSDQNENPRERWSDQEVRDEYHRTLRDLQISTPQTGSANYGIGGYIRRGQYHLDDLEKEMDRRGIKP
jgi:hypothetical protein